MGGVAKYYVIALTLLGLSIVYNRTANYTPYYEVAGSRWTLDSNFMAYLMQMKKQGYAAPRVDVPNKWGGQSK